MSGWGQGGISSFGHGDREPEGTGREDPTPEERLKIEQNLKNRRLRKIIRGKKTYQEKRNSRQKGYH